MKKVILVLILLGGAGAGTYYWKSSDSSKKDDAPTLGKITRGSIKQIVGSTGKVVSNLDVDIKCKASGTVAKLPYDISDSVPKDEVVCKIIERDMKRVVDQATVNRNSSQAKLTTARQNLAIAERNLKTDTDRAKATLDSARVAAKDARAKAERMKELFDKKLASQEECDTAETAATQAESGLESCQIKLEELKTQEQALEVQRQNVKLAEGEVAADEIALEIANDAFKDCTVYAPMNGVVTARTIQEGTIIASAVSNVAGGTTILTLSDLSRIFVLASVDESDIGKVNVGQPATITVDAYPGMQFAGKVVRIASKGVNLQNVVTFEVKIEVLGALKHAKLPGGEKGRKPDRGGRGRGEDRGPRAGQLSRDAQASRPSRDAQASRPAEEAEADKSGKNDAGDSGDLIREKKSLLKPEMTANIEIITAEKKDTLLIPVLAVSRLSGQFYANIPDTDETPEKKPVEIGISDGENYELINGMAEGDTVVIRKGLDSKWSNNGQRQGQRPGQNNPARMMNMGRGR